MKHPLLRLCLAILFACVALTGCGQEEMQQQKVQNLLAEALRQEQLGHSDQAKVWIDRAVAVNPQDVNTYVFTPTSLTDAGRLSIASILGPSGITPEGTGDDPRLIMYMRDATRKFPQDYRPWQSLVDAERRLGQTATQRADAATLAGLLEKRLRTPRVLAPGELTSLLLAQAYLDAGDPTKGFAAYQAAVSAYPRNPDPANALAYAYAVADRKADLPQALTLVNTALTLAKHQDASDQTLGAYQDTLGWVQYRQADFQDALLNVGQGVATNPRLAEGRYHLGLVYAALGQTENARAELNHALLLSPGYADAQAALDKLAAQAPAVAARRQPVSSPLMSGKKSQLLPRPGTSPSPTTLLGLSPSSPGG